jgi:hypothetical protein
VATNGRRLSRRERKVREWMERQEPVVADAEAVEPVPVGKPLPPGLNEALKSMATLTQELRSRQTGPVTTNIDVFEDQWVFLVRGIRPDFKYWNGYKVFWMRRSKPTWAGGQ